MFSWHRGAGPRLLHALCHYMLQAEIILADFNLGVSNPTTKPPNLIPSQIYWLYGIILTVSQHAISYLIVKK